MRSVHHERWPRCPVLAEIEDIPEDDTTDDGGEAERFKLEVPEADELHEWIHQTCKVCGELGNKDPDLGEP